MTDKEWDEFVKHWQGKWINKPDRSSVEEYIKWMVSRGGTCWAIEQLSAPDFAKDFYKE